MSELAQKLQCTLVLDVVLEHVEYYILYIRAFIYIYIYIYTYYICVCVCVRVCAFKIPTGL